MAQNSILFLYIFLILSYSCSDPSSKIEVKLEIDEILFHFDSLNLGPCDDRLFEVEFGLELRNMTDSEVEMKFEPTGIIKSAFAADIDTFLINSTSIRIYPNEKLIIGCNIQDFSFRKLYYSSLCNSKEDLRKYFSDLELYLDGWITVDNNQKDFKFINKLSGTHNIFFTSKKGESKLIK